MQPAHYIVKKTIDGFVLDVDSLQFTKVVEGKAASKMINSLFMVQPRFIDGQDWKRRTIGFHTPAHRSFRTTGERAGKNLRRSGKITRVLFHNFSGGIKKKKLNSSGPTS